MDTGEVNSSGKVKWTLNNSAELPKKDAGPKYSRISEHFRHVTPGALQCSMFCGGKQCKYENPAKFKSEEMAIQGLYSSWVTPDILATARPSTEVIRTYAVIEQFSKVGIKSLINLQHPGEHVSCGFGIDPVSGFSYDPEDFMKDDIFFYNFGWNDYGVRSLESILDMVKVMSFALKEGKVAIHCHAGLGRTGVLIACYLVYSDRIGAEEAIHKVRSNRPKAVQTRGQIQCVIDFTNFLNHLWVIFPCCASSAKPFTLQQYLKRQRLVLHGEEDRVLKHVPKVVYICCRRLLELAGVKREDAPLTWKFSRDAKAVFAEADDSFTTSDLDRETVEDSLCSDVADSLRHNPYVDSSLPLFEGSRIYRSESCDASVDDAFGDGEGRQLRHPDVTNQSRRRSDLTVGLPGEGRPKRVQLKPLNVLKRPKDEKGKQTRPNQSLKAKDNDREGPEVDTDRNWFKESATLSETDRIQVAKSMASSACVDSTVHSRTERIKRKLNTFDCWEEVLTESDAWVLTRLLWAWLGSLVEPVLTEKEVSLLEQNDDPIEALKRLDRGKRDTLECLITTICKLQPLPRELGDRVLRNTAMILTHNKELSLTSASAYLCKVQEHPEAEPSPNQSANELQRLDGTSESEIRSTSCRVLFFLRHVVNTLKNL